VLVAPNIADAYLTINRIYYVVDHGFAKKNVYNPKLGIYSLVIISISCEKKLQRAHPLD
jgi:HrpA-like RNA helicase